MSIAEITTAQLVRNRVHELTDLVIEINANSTSTATLFITPSAVHVDIAGAEGFISGCILPPAITSEQALGELESIVANVRDSMGGAQ